MIKRFRYILLGLAGACGIIVALTAPARSQLQAAKETMNERLARLSELEEGQVEKLLTLLGPAVQDELKSGKEVSFPGLGTFRVVRIPEHKDLQNGRPIVVPAVNTVEFLPTDGLKSAANGPDAAPAATVPQYEQPVLPGQTPGQKTGRVRTPPTRIR